MRGMRGEAHTTLDRREDTFEDEAEHHEDDGRAGIGFHGVEGGGAQGPGPADHVDNADGEGERRVLQQRDGGRSEGWHGDTHHLREDDLHIGLPLGQAAMHASVCVRGMLWMDALMVSDWNAAVFSPYAI